jgi:hypothetical protein
MLDIMKRFLGIGNFDDLADLANTAARSRECATFKSRKMNR